MKNKVKTFLKEKKDIIIFVIILLLVFGSVIAISKVALNKSNKVAPAINPDIPAPTEPIPTEEPVISPSFSLPIKGDYVIRRNYYDMSYDTKVLENALIISETSISESKGISYSKEDNSSFDVLSIIDGVVSDIVDSEIYGNVVYITHDDGIISKYMSLSSVSVNIGDSIKTGDKIGISGESLYDIEALNHVHLEIINNGVYIDPTNIFGKTIEEIITTK